MSQSETILARIYAAEAINAARNRQFALTADQENRPGDARRFRALAVGQQIHADKSLHILLGIAQPTDDNLVVSKEHVSQAVEICSAAIMTAATERESLIESLMTQFMKSAMNHGSLLDHQGEGMTDYYVCQICGFIAEDSPPNRCPVCRAVPEQFLRIE